MKDFSKLSANAVAIFMTTCFLCLSTMAQTPRPTPTFKEYAAKYEAELMESKIEREYEGKVIELEGLIAKHPEKADYFRQQIVKNLFWLKASTDRLLKTVGEGFVKPEKKLYANIAAVLANRGEHLESALKFLEMESKVEYIYKPNDAYSPPCLWCIESEIRYKQGNYQKVISLIEPTFNNSSQLKLIVEYSPPNLKILGLSYFKVGRIDDAIKIFLRIVSETNEPKIQDRKTLAKFYIAKNASLNGLNKAIIENHRKWRDECFIKPYILNIESPKWNLPNFKGKSVSLSEFSNKIVVLRFFTSQIRGKENRDYMKSIQQLHEKYKDRGVFVIGIDGSYPHPKDIRLQWFKETFEGMIITFPILLDNRRELAMQYGLAEEMTVLIDKKGIIRFNTAYLPLFIEQLEFVLKHKGKL